jgi:hypothetical protein
MGLQVMWLTVVVVGGFGSVIVLLYMILAAIRGGK